jgi:hypothetical protein
MKNLRLKVLYASGHTLTISHPCGDGIGAVHAMEYRDGDRIVIDHGGEKGLYWMQLDEALGQALVYFTDDEFSYPIPMGDKRVCFSPKAFSGSRHVLHVRPATEAEAKAYRNVAFNPYDNHGITGFYPHAHANVETRNEMTFAARNAIDGIFENGSHGEYPYSSWGINRDPNACLTVDFGRSVTVDLIRLTLRADFPHDSWWTEATVTFSDSSSLVLPLKKTPLPQPFPFEAKTVSSLQLDRLVKADDGSPFPALTQIELFGRD